MNLILSGFLLLVFQTVISWLSRLFIFGVGHSERPILEFLFLELASFAVYLMAIEGLRKNTQEKQPNRWMLAWIFLISIACRLIYFPSNPIQESDPYRYIWDGQTVLRGENPYRNLPESSFREISRRGMVTQEARDVFYKINHAGIKTIYPPVAQFLFAIAQWISPWKLFGWKLLGFACEISTLLFFAALLTKSGIRSEWILLYAWSPLVIKEFSNSLHVDAFVIFFLSLTLYCLMKERFKSAYFFLALATLVKWFALTLLPLLILWTFKKNKRQAVAGTFFYTLTCFLFYVPFLNAGIFLFEGLGRFAGEWRVNESIFGIISYFVTLLFPQKIFISGLIARGITLVIFLFAEVLVLKWFSKKQTFNSFAQACLMIIATLFFLAPTGNPWYFTWIFPFLFFLPLRSLILFSGLVFLYYLDFYFTYHGKAYWFQWVRLAEYGIFFLTLGMELWIKNRRFPLSFRSKTKERLLPARSAI